jgi:DNA-directed RNA polymerase subunit L
VRMQFIKNKILRKHCKIITYEVEHLEKKNILFKIKYNGDLMSIRIKVRRKNIRIYKKKKKMRTLYSKE